MPAPPLVEPPACEAVERAEDRAPCRSPDVDGSARPARAGVDDDRDAVALAELLDEQLQRALHAAAACCGSSIEPETSIRKTRLRGGRSSGGDLACP